ncbi:alpha/beta hydrolase [Halorientalis sp. IM1011]|uniref:dienelactone hydrolase family protein n=1 Tax=Halorientalis sp. IM1011 TaxID=1932360 RepID=UPI00097CC0FC|nr:dienelactone hydrolase family protein [Halorientalis sp. IM1011]AQL43502.1 alpha/beta hydrolase [Halorientalis sp. IM1011]
MSEERRIAGDREVRVTVDTPEADRGVVACPPHPQMGGTRSDPRLRAVGEALGERGIACLRFDYGPWDEGEGERRDALNVLASARDDYDAVSIFGYSFGAGVALLAAADAEPAAVSVLAPPASLGERDTVAALSALACPVQVLFGERDSTVDWEPIVERARERGDAVESIPGDHFFAGQVDRIGESVAAFLSGERS